VGIERVSMSVVWGIYLSAYGARWLGGSLCPTGDGAVEGSMKVLQAQRIGEWELVRLEFGRRSSYRGGGKGG
jgi:hypothetical protein